MSEKTIIKHPTVVQSDLRVSNPLFVRLELVEKDDNTTVSTEDQGQLPASVRIINNLSWLSTVQQALSISI